ncbi:3-hydroxyacyl-CoA dehydrogenase [Corynebacterium breve]|uniref:3-hydroxyacyl-CoA dehydrogenase n=1 Tax=Corynebacterium breve TaxID=3049799 RepID=A0ABY8VLL6_9CORY|nr:3-hydroxyacyl-CoA dehydrogenase [Corynebacterium breve]WIM69079.1 3-hydroxyacyl-CoA dehydrogenase [Corynebacterium breve]
MNNVAVLGAGVLGAQIAFCTAHAGFNVVSWDISDEALAAAKTRFEGIAQQYNAEMPEATDQAVADALNRITLTTDLEEAAKRADLVIEAVPENIDIKRDVWSKVGAAAPEHTIFATNTSTLLPSSFADACGYPERFLALHFANHIWIQNTAEVMPHAGTRPELVDQVAAFAEQIKMVPIRLRKEQPGYVLNTLLVPFLQAGQYLFANGVADPADIDMNWRNSTGAPSGPFQIMDRVGLRTVLAVRKSHGAPSQPWEETFVKFLEDKIAEGKTGAEAGEGFYRYDDNGRIIG